MSRRNNFFSFSDENLSLAILTVSFGAYLWIFLPLIPADGKSMGHDYSSYLPNLLAGYYWLLQNGPLAIPWFSPAQCGGVPYFPDLAVGYFSLPQWLAFAVGPITAVRFSFVLLAGLGAIGFYLLVRDRFAVASAAAAAASVLFLFSGFFTYRMAIGHLVFHPYALTPWLAWAVLAPRPQIAGRVESICSTAWPPAIGGLAVASMFQAGMVHVIPCVFLAVAVILLVHGELHGHRSRPWMLLAAATVVGCALSASRINAVMAFLEHFPRTDYPLPGFSRLRDLLGTAAAVLFWRVSATDAMEKMQNARFYMGAHEWEFGLGPAALALLAAGAVVALARLRKAPLTFSRIAPSIPAWSAIAIACALPLVLNWYEPHWNRLLKSLPYFASSSTLLRWFALYIPVIALLAGLALHRIAPGGRSSLAGAVLVSAATVAWNAAGDKSYYTDQSYDGARVERAWHVARSSGRVPPITHVGLLHWPSGELVNSGRNDALTLGLSQRLCYQPTFGYQLEKFPVGPLRLGAALKEVGPGVLNVKNPACYVFPRENACVPGDHFSTGQRDDAERFLRYETFPFTRSARQLVSDGVTLAALNLVAALIFGTLFFGVRRALRAGKSF